MIATDNTIIDWFVYITVLKRSYKITVSLYLNILHLKGWDPAKVWCYNADCNTLLHNDRYPWHLVYH